MGLLQATATNIISMVGVGPFLTIPFMVAAMNGPHVIYAWIAGLVLALADGLVYAQLGAALPGSGGGYLYLREAFKPFGLGGLMAFLFIFQTILIAPLSVAGGAVGFADYLQFVWTAMTPLQHNLIAAAVCIVSTALLWRRIEEIGRLAVVMLVVVLITVGWVIVAGLFTFSPAQAFDFPPEAFTFDRIAADERRRRIRAGDVQLRRLQPGLQHRRRDREPARHDSAVDRPLDLHRCRALHADDDRHPRHDPVAGSEGIAHGRIAVHRADLLGSVHRPDRRPGDDRIDPVRGRRVALRDDSRLLANPLRGRARRRLLQGLRARASEEGLPGRFAGHDRDRLDPVLLFLAGSAGQLVDSSAGAVALHLAMRGGDPAPPLPPRHPAAVHDVALPLAGDPVGRAVAVHLLHRALGRDRVLGWLPAAGMAYALSNV